MAKQISFISFMCFFLLGISSCDAKVDKYEVTTLCTFDSKEKACFVDKEKGKKKTFEQINGYVCMSFEDLQTMLLEFYNCKDK